MAYKIAQKVWRTTNCRRSNHNCSIQSMIQYLPEQERMLDHACSETNTTDPVKQSNKFRGSWLIIYILSSFKKIFMHLSIAQASTFVVMRNRSIRAIWQAQNNLIIKNGAPSRTHVLYQFFRHIICRIYNVTIHDALLYQE